MIQINGNTKQGWQAGGAGAHSIPSLSSSSFSRARPALPVKPLPSRSRLITRLSLWLRYLPKCYKITQREGRDVLPLALLAEAARFVRVAAPQGRQALSDNHAAAAVVPAFAATADSS